MEIRIPKSIGTLEVNNLRPEGPNVIFAGDKHDSYQASRGITRFYLRLADQFGLKMTSYENVAGDGFTPPDFGKVSPEVELAFRKSLETVTSSEATFKILNKSEGFGLSDAELTDYRHMIPVTAEVLGKQLRQIGSIRERGFSPLAEACFTYIRLHKYIDDPEVEGAALGILESILDSVEALGPRFRKSFSEAECQMFEFESEDEIDWDNVVERVRKTNDMVSCMRTEDQLVRLTEAMDSEKVCLSLMVQGAAHRDDFIKAAQKLDIGSAIFIPYGLNIKHPVRAADYTKYFHGYMLNQMQSGGTKNGT